MVWAQQVPKLAFWVFVGRKNTMFWQFKYYIANLKFIAGHIVLQLGELHFGAFDFYLILH